MYCNPESASCKMTCRILWVGECRSDSGDVCWVGYFHLNTGKRHFVPSFYSMDVHFYSHPSLPSNLFIKAVIFCLFTCVSPPFLVPALYRSLLTSLLLYMRSYYKGLSPTYLQVHTTKTGFGADEDEKGKSAYTYTHKE